jgi:hypothetical protein
MASTLRLGLFDLPEFGDLLAPESRPRKNRTASIKTGGPAGGAPDRVGTLLRVARKAPEVIVKVTGTNAEAGPLKAHLRYLATHSKDPLLEDQDGNRVEPTREGRAELLDRWTLAMLEGRRQEIERERELAALQATAAREGREFVPPPPGPRRTIGVHIVLSMPKGSPAPEVMQAARAWAREELTNHQYVLALHRDKDHPHVHVLVNNIGHDLRPLSRNRDDTLRWRQRFARELRARGVEAEATPRKARGVLRRPENRRVTLLREKAQAARDFSGGRVLRAKIAQAENEARGITPRVQHPAEVRARANRARLEAGLRDAVQTLQTQGEAGQRAAHQVAHFLATLPPAETEMDRLRRAVSEARKRNPGRLPPQRDAPERGK